MEIDIHVIIYYIRMLIMNMCVFYCVEKILSIKEISLKNKILVFVINIFLIFIYVSIKSITTSLLPFAILCFVYSMVLAKLTKISLGCSMMCTLIAYAISFVCHTIGIVIQFVPYRLIYKIWNIDNMFISLLIISIIQILLIYGFFRIRRFKNGFSFLRHKLNNDITDIIVINISTIVIIIYSLFIIYNHEIAKNLFITFLTIGIMMFLTIQKMFTMYYKQKLLTDTMEEYKQELNEKQNEIDKLKNENKNVSKITHEFYNRQKALELLVANNMNIDNINKENVSQNVLKMIENLTSEYSERFEEIKELPKLELTGIEEIDNMFKYMQSECNKNGILFKLKVMGNVHSLVNNVIPKNRLETLIGDHLRDAINAVNLTDKASKEVLIILGVKDNRYELSIFDTGIDFEVDTLLKLGLEAVTTNKDRGGTGTGFMTTFETLSETKASLIITEYPDDENRHYTKCVCISFDNKKQYTIRSHRANLIKEKSKDQRIKIEDYKEKMNKEV